MLRKHTCLYTGVTHPPHHAMSRFTSYIDAKCNPMDWADYHCIWFGRNASCCYFFRIYGRFCLWVRQFRSSKATLYPPLHCDHLGLKPVAVGACAGTIYFLFLWTVSTPSRALASPMCIQYSDNWRVVPQRLWPKFPRNNYFGTPEYNQDLGGKAGMLCLHNNLHYRPS